ncbi:MAG: thiamine phosphate synthase [Myxococcaceae bacterium]
MLLVTDWSRGETRLLWALERACALGPQVGVQHRHPDALTRPFLAEARLLASLCARHANPLFINGRLDVALLVGAHLHLPVEAPTPADARPHLPAGRFVSASVHNEAELSRAQGADLVLLSPVFPPGSKPGDSRPTLGAEGYARLRALAPCPALALGGIRLERMAGLGPVAGVAVQSAVLDAPDPGAAAAALLATLNGAGAQPEPPPAGG